MSQTSHPHNVVGDGTCLAPMVEVVWEIAAPATVAGRLAWSISMDNGHSRATCTLHTKAGERTIINDAPAQLVFASGLTHVLVPASTDAAPLLTLTIAGDAAAHNPADLLFARTSLLDQLHVPGGAAEPPSLG